MIAIVYIGEARFPEISKHNHNSLFQALGKKYGYKIYDFTHSYRSWSVENLCSEQAQILDMHYALKSINEKVVIKLRTDVWICSNEISNIVSYVDEVVNKKIDFAYIGTNLQAKNQDKVSVLFKDNDYARFTHDLIVIFGVNKANNVETLLCKIPNQDQYRLNQGWWLFAKTKCFCKIIDADVYLIRDGLSNPTDNSVINAWFNFALSYNQNNQQILEELIQLKKQFKDKLGQTE